MKYLFFRQLEGCKEEIVEIDQHVVKLVSIKSFRDHWKIYLKFGPVRSRLERAAEIEPMSGGKCI